MTEISEELMRDIMKLRSTIAGETIGSALERYAYAHHHLANEGGPIVGVSGAIKLVTVEHSVQFGCIYYNYPILKAIMDERKRDPNAPLCLDEIKNKIG